MVADLFNDLVFLTLRQKTSVKELDLEAALAEREVNFPFLLKPFSVIVGNAYYILWFIKILNMIKVSSKQFTE